VDDWILLHNPASHRGAAALKEVERALESAPPAGARVHLVPIAELGALTGTPSRLIACGGDGTVNAAAQWLLERGGDCPLSILPAGTGNNLARGLGLPLDRRDALQVALRGDEVRRLDAIAYTSGNGTERRIMVQTSALGFPAEVAARYDALRRRAFFRPIAALTGPFVYRLLALASLRRQKRRERRGDLLRIRCRLPGEDLEEDVAAVFIGNERSIGGNFFPCPRAAVDDGAVDVCLVRAGTGAPYLDLFGKVMRGRHLGLERTVIYRQTPGPLSIELSEPSLFLVDGDLPVRSDRLRLEVLPGRFRVVTGT
jgi:diacylglycerol kinase (ATP)